MLYETISQGREFAALFSAGAALGAISLIFSGVRRLMRAGFWGNLICDCAMGFFWACIACAALTAACLGKARAFHILAMMSGGAFFMAAVSPALRRTAGNIARTAASAGRRCRENRFLQAVFR